MKTTTSMQNSSARFTNVALVNNGALNGHAGRPAREVDFREVDYRSFSPRLPALNRNRLLALLPDETRNRILPHLKIEKMPLGKVVYQAGDPERYVYFPVDAIVSLLCAMENGKSAEIAVVGSEGLVGVAAVLGGGNTSIRAVVQSAGTALRLPSQLLKEGIDRSCKLRRLTLRYTQTLIMQVSQTAVCNRHHSIEQQFCRRLLLSLDRVHVDEMILTQDLIASMLGVRRESVTAAAGKLRKLGAIESWRGHVKVLDREMLEELSCECYAVVKCETDRLLNKPGWCNASVVQRTDCRFLSCDPDTTIWPVRICAERLLA